MWQAWIGFNASHSLGAILFGLVFGYLAWVRPDVLFQSAFLLGLGLVVLVAHFVLGVRYWFRVPLAGISLSLGLYLVAVIVQLADG